MSICEKHGQMIVQIELSNVEDLVRVAVGVENALMVLIKQDVIPIEHAVSSVFQKYTDFSKRFDVSCEIISLGNHLLEGNSIPSKEKEFISSDSCIEGFMTNGNIVTRSSVYVAEKIAGFGYLGLLLQSFDEVKKVLNVFELQLTEARTRDHAQRMNEIMQSLTLTFLVCIMMLLALCIFLKELEIIAPKRCLFLLKVV